MRRALTCAALLAHAALLAAALPAMAETWLYESATTLPSTDTGWDHLTLDPAGTRLYVARRADGLLAWDPAARKGVTVENSGGANGVVLLPDRNRAYAAMTDGTVLAFDSTTLKPLDRTDLGIGPLNQGLYEPTQNRVHMVGAPGGEKTTWVTLDADSGAVLGKTEFNSRAMDPPATNGKGAIFAPMRDKSLLQQLDAKDLSLQKTWRLGDCAQPVAVQWDAAAERVLVACRGDKPVFVALNPATGIVATIPIGRGVDGLVLDNVHHLIVTANGTDASLSVIRQDGPDAYVLQETIATRPMARTLALDERSGRLFTVAASFTLPAASSETKQVQPMYHPDSFTVLTFGLK